MFCFPAPYVAAASGPTSVSFQASSTNDGNDVTAPASIDAGDLLVLTNHCLYQTGGGLPTGFTQIANISAISYVETIISYKIADGTEDSSSIVGMTNGGVYGNVYLLLQFRCDTEISTVTVQDLAQQITSGNPTSQTCNASGGSAPLIVIGSYCGVTSGTFTTTFSPAEDAEITDVGAYTRSYLDYKIYNSSPADHTIDMGTVAYENILSSFYLELS